ncbi:MAG: NnrU family protein, partial [Hyphomicrobiales bacterium]|nr:NnrU family protein [Hyphomicrobiales bacterium]
MLEAKAVDAMGLLALGLVIFLGVHSLRIVDEDMRSKAIARLGEGPWKGLYSLASLIG